MQDQKAKPGSIRSGPNFVSLRDSERDPIKLFKKHHITGDDKRV
jgi:hypothetical protein